MILQALVEYYEALERKGKITSPGWCRAKVAYGLDISEQGELKSVIPLKQERQKGKKTVTVPQNLTVPQMVSRSSGVSANFLCDHSGYMLGIDNKGKPERSRECFECAKKKHKDILEHISSPAARAVCRFFDRWAPDQAAENPCLIPELEEIISGSNLVFMMDGEYVHEDPDIRQCWEEYSRQSGTGPEGVCLVTGRREEIARIHGTIKGVQGAQSSCMAIFVEAEVDLETGNTKLVKVAGGTDIGQIIDSKAVEMQLHGGFGSACIDTAIFEECILDPSTGRLLTSSLIDYKWRTFNEFPPYDAYIMESQIDSFMFKALGIGEISGAAGASAVLMAISNAIGVDIKDYPATPAVILKALGKA